MGQLIVDIKKRKRTLSKTKLRMIIEKISNLRKNYVIKKVLN